MNDEQRDRIWLRRATVHEVEVDSVDWQRELWQVVDLLFNLSPGEATLPVFCQALRPIVP